MNYLPKSYREKQGMLIAFASEKKNRLGLSYKSFEIPVAICFVLFNQSRFSLHPFAISLFELQYLVVTFSSVH